MDTGENEINPLAVNSRNKSQFIQFQKLHCFTLFGWNLRHRRHIDFLTEVVASEREVCWQRHPQFALPIKYLFASFSRKLRHVWTEFRDEGFESRGVCRHRAEILPCRSKAKHPQKT